jgi:hypothetical protein
MQVVAPHHLTQQILDILETLQAKLRAEMAGKLRLPEGVALQRLRIGWPLPAGAVAGTGSKQEGGFYCDVDILPARRAGGSEVGGGKAAGKRRSEGGREGNARGRKAGVNKTDKGGRRRGAGEGEGEGEGDGVGRSAAELAETLVDMAIEGELQSATAESDADVCAALRRCLGLRVQGLGFMFQRLGFRA